uniref:Uncharacterized protein n=1 Tax=Calcidiscus leptoporus TaxID=127549 RepID=A0A7S0ISH8_9EUKA
MARLIVLGIVVFVSVVEGARLDSLAPADPGAQLEPLPEDAAEERARRRRWPLGMGWLRAGSGECLGCIKECLGVKLHAMQASTMKYQAPLSLLTWYLFRNRPFRMWPLEDIVGKLFKVSPAVYGFLAAVGYQSCQRQCDSECPYPGIRSAPSDTMPDLEQVNAADFSAIAKLLQPQSSRRRGGGLASAFGQLLRV